MSEQNINIYRKKYFIQLVPISFLRQSEEVNIDAVNLLSENIHSEGTWKTAIPVEKESGWVMDGNHRLRVAHNLGLKYIPVIRLQYGDPRVSVHRWANGSLYPLDQLINEIKQRVLLPFKTTKHLFNPGLPQIKMSLDRLRVD